MNEQLIDVNLLSDKVTLATLNIELNALGKILICCGCHEVEALIEGLLIIEQEEQAWPLCGECLRRLPLAGSIV